MAGCTALVLPNQVLADTFLVASQGQQQQQLSSDLALQRVLLVPVRQQESALSGTGLAFSGLAFPCNRSETETSAQFAT
jgi:hypothetical protein